jgi:hypothetical protein
LQQAVDDLQDSDADQYNKSDVDGFLNDKQDTLTVGPGIDITNNVISVIGGADGREVELSANATHIQWRYAGDATWSDLVPLSDLTGAQGNEGKSVELRVDSNILQWRRVGDVAWANLLDLSLLAPSVDLTNYYTKSDADARYATAAQGAKADNALQDDAPTDGYDYVLMFNSGQKIWAQVY